jgi:DNA-binding response OmpR family regulator
MEKEDVVRGFNSGAKDYVTKPFDPYELMSRVKLTWNRRMPRRN